MNFPPNQKYVDDIDAHLGVLLSEDRVRGATGLSRLVLRKGHLLDDAHVLNVSETIVFETQFIQNGWEAYMLADALKDIIVHTGPCDDGALFASSFETMMAIASVTENDAAGQVYGLAGTMMSHVADTYSAGEILPENWTRVATSLFDSATPGNPAQQQYCRLLVGFADNIYDRICLWHGGLKKDAIHQKIRLFEDAGPAMTAGKNNLSSLMQERYRDAIVSRLRIFATALK